MAWVLDQIRDDAFARRPCYQLRVSYVVTEAGVKPGTVYKKTERTILELPTFLPSSALQASSAS